MTQLDPPPTRTNDIICLDAGPAAGQIASLLLLFLGYNTVVDHLQGTRCTKVYLIPMEGPLFLNDHFGWLLRKQPRTLREAIFLDSCSVVSGAESY